MNKGRAPAHCQVPSLFFLGTTPNITVIFGIPRVTVLVGLAVEQQIEVDKVPLSLKGLYIYDIMLS